MHLVKAAIRNYHRLSGLNSKPLFLTVLEAGSVRSEYQVSPVLVPAYLLACSLTISFFLFFFPHHKDSLP